jgi:predicted GNAT family acetyltransferase
VSEIRHHEQRSAYEYLVDGEVVAVADYRDDGEQIEMHHTYTDPAHRGQGIAATLVAAALDDIRRRDRRVVPTCWFVAEFLDDHPEYQDLRATA